MHLMGAALKCSIISNVCIPNNSVIILPPSLMYAIELYIMCKNHLWMDAAVWCMLSGWMDGWLVSLGRGRYSLNYPMSYPIDHLTVLTMI